MSTEHTPDPAQLVTAARDGDPSAQDALVGMYLPLVYNIVGRALNGSLDVDDVVQETMLRALGGLGGLRSPDSFRPWLVSIAMNQVRTHWQDRGTVTGGVEEAAELADPGGDFVDLTLVRLQLSGQRQETALATRWLEPEDRALLSLWWLECAGELTRAEVAAALELSPQHTAVRVQRMKAQLEAARVLVRALAAPPCEELRGVLATWDGRPSALWRKRIARHARACVRCSGLWSGLVPAEGLLAGLALVGVSAGLAESLRAGTTTAMTPVAAVSHGESGPDASGTAPGRAAARRRAGRAPSRGEARRRRRVRRRAVGGAVVAACVVGGGLWYLGPDTGGGDGATATARASGDPVADLSERSPAEPSAPTSGSPSASASASASAPASASASVSPSASKKAAAGKPPTVGKKAPETREAPAPPVRTTPTAPATRAVATGTVAQVVALVNKERSKAGCGPVAENADLDQAARGHSDDMAARNFFEHSNPDGADPGKRITAAGYRWSTYGENIAKGQPTPASVMDSWMNSPGHRANILNCSFKEIGVGVHNGGSGGPWWTQDFGARL
ncbi:sigma-70 family RNA polymerase sigma factor [Streptomyces sp. J2-1]|uniref:sigma-70 family RNA polymerase sigma factor n=1 Tax=Streptomyces corallincola TaxID=2851888 RepID=UPI001C38B575|nr:sigma-70 family RNA polymerase sigma factor [Streptomyces corallincola]MBV2354074.1 sigma-70 family RNA polymerase sigma factor [Streptomyces corallincola]